MIQISKAAAREIKRLQKNRQQTDTPLRLTLQAGGCSGLVYIFEFDAKDNTSDTYFESNDISIAVSEENLECLQGLTIDYSEDLMGGAFRFDNPQAINTCSCGNSFAIVAQ